MASSYAGRCPKANVCQGAISGTPRQPGLDAFLLRLAADFPAFQCGISVQGFGIDKLASHDEDSLVVWPGRIARLSEISGFVDETDLQERRPEKALATMTVAKGSAARALLARGIRLATFSAAWMNLDRRECKRMIGFGVIQSGNWRRQR